MQVVIARFGRARSVETVRAVLDEARAAWRVGSAGGSLSEEAAVARCAGLLEAIEQPSLRPVFNLTGTVLHTNLGVPCFRPRRCRR